MTHALTRARRAQRVAAALADRGIDALVVTSTAAIAYVADIDTRSFATRWNAAIVRDDASVSLVTAEADRLTLEAGGYAGDTAHWTPGNERTSFLATIASVVRRTSSMVRVGVEDAALFPNGSLGLFGLSYPPGSIVPAGDVIDEVSRVKDEDEIARLREAANLADVAYTATVDRLHPELRVYEIVRNVDRSVRAAGGGGWWSPAESPRPLIATAAFPHGSVVSLLDRRPETGILDPAANLPFQLHPLARNYTGAAGTTVVFRAPDLVTRERASRLSDALHAAIAALTPGTTGGEVHRAFSRLVASDVTAPTLIGFSVGTGAGEVVVRAGGDVVLQSGMALCLHASIAGSLERPGISFQTTVLVTESTPERLDVVLPLRLVELH